MLDELGKRLLAESGTDGYTGTDTKDPNENVKLIADVMKQLDVIERYLRGLRLQTAVGASFP
jgi:hypothetical protein